MMNEKARAHTVQPLATILKRRRESLDISLSEAEQATRIRGQYIEALEAGDYDALKDDVYTKGYVKNYADFLGLETKPIVKLYEQERAGQREMRRQSRRGSGVQLGVKPIKSARMVVTPKTFVLFSVIAVVGLVVSYIIWQVIALSAPPKLTINNNEARLVNDNYGYVSGKVAGGADLFINDSPVLVSADGTFRERIALIDGRNEIKLTAKNRLGRSSSQTYVITARIDAAPTVALSPTPSTSVSPGASPSPSLSPPALDGVRVVVTIRDQASWMVIQADGKEVFRGTMLAGTTQTFNATDTIIVSTGNAGATQLVVTNRVVQNKDIGSLGAPGEVRRDIVIGRDTKF